MAGLSASGLKTQIRSYTEVSSTVLSDSVLENIILIPKITYLTLETMSKTIFFYSPEAVTSLNDLHIWKKMVEIFGVKVPTSGTSILIHYMIQFT